jgi:hypothetical protein
MPLRLEVFPPDRILIGVATGKVTLQEFRDFLVEVVKSGVLHYRKIIDVSLATSNVIGKDELLAMDKMLNSVAGTNRGRGPLAIVTDPSRDENAQNAQIFKELAAKDRPVEVFQSIYQARRWVMAQPTRDI